ncbi:hypothetical protein BDR05DRAFT_999666 [Suillus weaverae]|nr:hypothetical protein BDR05DRAFT_999666 [Suillus weaverae]
METSIHGHAVADENTMDGKPWEEFGESEDNMLEREDEYIVWQCQYTKCPYPSPSPPLTSISDTPAFPSHGRFQSHADHAINHSPLRSPKSLSSIASSSSASSSRRTHTSSIPSRSSHISSVHKPGTTCKPSQKSSLSQHVDVEMGDVQGQVQSLTDGMSYIYTAKAAASEYKITKVNANRHLHDIKFQHEQANKEQNEAAIVHQHAQESKSLDLQVLEAKKATPQLEIELVKLKGGSLSG